MGYGTGFASVPTAVCHCTQPEPGIAVDLVWRWELEDFGPMEGAELMRLEFPPVLTGAAHISQCINL